MRDILNMKTTVLFLLCCLLAVSLGGLSPREFVEADTAALHGVSHLSAYGACAAAHFTISDKADMQNTGCEGDAGSGSPDRMPTKPPPPPPPPPPPLPVVLFG